MSSGGSELREALSVDFCGDPCLAKARVLRSVRLELLEVADDWYGYVDDGGFARDERRARTSAIAGTARQIMSLW